MVPAVLKTITPVEAFNPAACKVVYCIVLFVAPLINVTAELPVPVFVFMILRLVTAPAPSMVTYFAPLN